MKTYGRRQAEESEFLLPLVLLGSLVKRGVARAWAVLWFPAGWVLRSLEQRRKNFLANTSVEQRVRLFRLLLASHFLMGALSAAALHWTQLSAALLLATPLFLFALCCFALLRSTPGVLAFLSTLAFVACLPAILHTVPFLVAAVTPLLRLASSHLPILLLPLAPFSGPVRPPAPVEPYQRPSGLPLHRPTDPHALSDEAVSSLIPLDSPLMTDKNKRQQDEPEQLDIVHPQQDNFIFEHAQGKNQ
ncbi:MAG: hypothetical protein Q8P67_08040, partial [archaeon]|nr:hypothetical protein [archaeon]